LLYKVKLSLQKGRESEIEAELEKAGFDDVRWYRPATITYGMLAFSARYT